MARNPYQSVRSKLFDRLAALGIKLPENAVFIEHWRSSKALSGKPEFKWTIDGTTINSRHSVVELTKAASIEILQEGELTVLVPVGLTRTGKRGGRRDLAGQQFGLLTVAALHHSNSRRDFWLCECECGCTKVVSGQILPRTRSCGCIRSGNQEWHSWNGARSRCYTESHVSYHLYGGRGIYMVPEWDTFERFLADMGKRPGPEFSLDRLDPDGPYGPMNCEWTDDQGRTRRTTHVVEYNGEPYTIKELALEFDINWRTLYARIFRYGMPVDEAVSRG